MDDVFRSLLSSYGAKPRPVVPNTLGPDMDDPSLALLRRFGISSRPQHNVIRDSPALSSGFGGGLGMPESRLNMFGD